MDKKQHNKNYLLLVLLIVNLLLGIIFSYVHVYFNESGLKYIAKHIDINTYLKSNEDINIILENKKIPIEVFDYIDIKEYEKDVDLFFDERKASKEKVESLLVNSIKQYENINMVDVYSNIESDVERITNIICSDLNDDMSKKIDSIVLLGKISYIFNVLAIIFTVLMIVKDKAFMYAGLSYMGTSAVIFMTVKDVVATKAKEYLNIDGVNHLSDSLSNICSIYFIIGIIIVLISLIFVIRNVLKDLKRSYIDYEWRYK